MARLGLALLLLAAHGSRAGAEPCPPAVQLDGGGALRDQVLAALAERGIGAAPRASCPVIAVRVEPDGAAIRLSIVDPDGRPSVRVVSSAKTAAALIETWARPELYTARLPEPAAPRAVAVPAAEREDPPVLRPPGASASAVATLPVSIDLGPTSALGADGSLWVGATAHACVRGGPACIGVLARAMADTQLRGESRATQTERTSADVLIAVDVPRRVLGLVVTPGASFGLGFERHRRDDDAVHVAEADGGALRAGLHLGVATRVARRWSVGVDVSIDVSMLTPSDELDADELDDAMELAPAPRAFARLGLQLRYDAR